ncbi:MAG: GlxA family transcriptional regulator [Amphritea sp.]
MPPERCFQSSAHTVSLQFGRVSEKTIRTQEVAFLLLPGADMTCLSTAINVLRHANRIAGYSLYKWRLFSHDGHPLLAEDGFVISVHQAINDVDPVRLDKLIVCGGQRFQEKRVLRWLRRAAGAGLCIGALGQGSYPLARAGLLDYYCCTTHWEFLASLQEEYPRLVLSSQLYVIDRDRFSCAGGSGVQDMMLHLVGLEQGAELALAVSEVLVCGMRLPSEPQRGSSRRLLMGYTPPQLLEAISLMESNIEEPLKIQELSELLGISRRQLERLFSKYLNTQPSRYYMEIRLNQARSMLQQTNKSILEISIACGFSRASHFSNIMKEQFGCSPSSLYKRTAL